MANDNTRRLPDSLEEFFDIWLPIVKSMVYSFIPGIDAGGCHDVAMDRLVEFIRGGYYAAYDPAKGQFNSYIYGFLRKTLKRQSANWQRDQEADPYPETDQEAMTVMELRMVAPDDTEREALYRAYVDQIAARLHEMDIYLQHPLNEPVDANVPNFRRGRGGSHFTSLEQLWHLLADDPSRPYEPAALAEELGVSRETLEGMLHGLRFVPGLQEDLSGRVKPIPIPARRKRRPAGRSA